jgi:hypothetical protein
MQLGILGTLAGPSGHRQRLGDDPQPIADASGPGGSVRAS